MDAREAFDALGFRAHYELVNMVKALTLHQWQNTPDEEHRLKAARWALRHREAYSREMRWRRDNPKRPRATDSSSAARATDDASRDIWTPTERKALSRATQYVEAL